jgi:hypothetical protein
LPHPLRTYAPADPKPSRPSRGRPKTFAVARSLLETVVLFTNVGEPK